MQVVLTAPSGVKLLMEQDYIGRPQGTPIAESLAGVPGGVQARGEKVSRLKTGSIVSPVRRDGREIKLKGWAHFGGVERSAQVQRLAATISGMWQDGDSLGLLAYDTAGIGARSTAVQPDPDGEWTLDDSKHYRGWLRWSLDLIAPDPYLYGEAREWQLVPVGTGLGLREPLGQPGYLDFGAVTNTQVQIPNGGNSTAWPVFEVRVDDGAGFRLTTGGKSVVFAGMCSRDVPITVDMAGRVLQSGVDRSVMLRVRDWIGIPAGGTETVWLETLQGGAGSAIATVRDTWI